MDTNVNILSREYGLLSELYLYRKGLMSILIIVSLPVPTVVIIQ